MKKLYIVPFLFLLAACGDKSTVLTVTYYPEMPDLPLCSASSLRVPEAEYPRKMNAEPFVRNLTTCKSTDPKERSTAAWMERCLEKPIDTESNIFIGFNQQNWTELNFNLAQINENYKACQARIEEVNKQRAEWREKNQSSRDKQKLTENP
jgi:hypothetical protein